MAKKKLLYINNFEAPYRVPFFNILAREYDMTLALSERPEDIIERNSKWFEQGKRDYKVVYLKTKKIFGVKISFEIKKMLSDFDIVFMDMYSNPTNIYAIYHLNRMKKPFVMSVDGMLPKPNEPKLLFKLKKYLLNSPKIVLSPSKYVDERIQHYGVDASKIRRYNFTSLTQADINDAKVMKSCDKKNLREKLGIKESRMIISVGRFSYGHGYRKGFDTLLKTSEKLSKDIGVYIIGDSPTEEFKEWKNKKNLSHVHFIEFKQKPELAQYYAAADLFVLLTREDIWGLVINEAMSFGLPVITTDKCVAGLQLVQEGENGYIVAVEDVENSYKRIFDIVNNDAMLARYSAKSFDVISKYTIENMASRHIEVFNELF